MKIIIVGCGKVGGTLAEQLQEKDIDLTLIDKDAAVIEQLTEDIDAMGIVGNGSSINILMDAGVDTADILIAVTDSDELNLLCCLIAQKTGHCQTIARVRNPVYSQEIGFIRERLGLSMIINPELAAAREISRILRFPAAITIESFSKGRAELLKFKVLPEFHLDGMTISQINERYHCDLLFCAIENKEGVTIPDGNHVIQNSDIVSIIATPQNTAQFFKQIGLKTQQVKSTLIIGGGTIAYYLAGILTSLHIDVKIIEKDRTKCEDLSEALPDVTIINGDGTERDILRAEGIDKAESIVALTDVDEENIFLALYARKNTNAKLAVKVNRLPYTDIIDSLDIGSVIYPKYITADYILRYVRAMQNTIGSNVETLYHILDSKAEALEFIIRDNSPVVGVPLAKLNLRKDLLVCCIARGGEIRIPRGQDTIEIGDNVVIVTTHKGLRDIRDILVK